MVNFAIKKAAIQYREYDVKRLLDKGFSNLEEAYSLGLCLCHSVACS